MAHERAADDELRETGITRLVAAEREWRSALEAADVEAARLIDEARAAELEADVVLERELDALVSARSLESRRELQDRCQALLREADQRAALYDGVGAERELAVATAIVGRLWREGLRPVADRFAEVSA